MGKGRLQRSVACPDSRRSPGSAVLRANRLHLPTWVRWSVPGSPSSLTRIIRTNTRSWQRHDEPHQDCSGLWVKNSTFEGLVLDMYTSPRDECKHFSRGCAIVLMRPQEAGACWLLALWVGRTGPTPSIHCVKTASDHAFCPLHRIYTGSGGYSFGRGVSNSCVYFFHSAPERPGRDAGKHCTVGDQLRF